MNALLKTLRLALVLATAGLISAQAAAQTFPTKPVRLVVPTAAGGPVDGVARGLAERLSKIWNQPVVVDNRPGGNEIIGADLVAKAPADGYTILFGTDGTFSNNQFMFSNMPFNPVTDLIPIGRTTFIHMVFIVPGELPVKDLKEFVALIKANPGKYAYASGGIGSATHIYFNAFLLQNDLKMTHVPYQGIAPAIQGMLNGSVVAFMAGATAATPYLPNGKMKILAINGDKRAKSIPNVPTLAEAGFPKSEMYLYLGLAVPKGTPRPIIDEIARAHRKVLSDREFVEKVLDTYAFEPISETPEEFAAFLVKERAKKQKDIREANVKLD